jgi:TPR repeat protein
MAGSDDDTDVSFADDREGRDAQSTFERGNRLAQQGDLAGAEKAYRRADELGHPTAAALAGLFSEGRGETAEAQDAYRRADERGDGLGAFRLGLLLAHNGDWDTANEAWRRADERGEEQLPFDPERLMRGRAPQRRRTVPEAERAESRSAFANPVLIGAVAVLGC